MNGAEMADSRRRTEGEFVQVFLAEDDSARERSPYVCRVDVVFDSHRDPVERTAPSTTLHISFGFTRLRHCLIGSHGDEGVQRRVQLLNPLPRSRLSQRISVTSDVAKR